MPVIGAVSHKYQQVTWIWVSKALVVIHKTNNKYQNYPFYK